MKTETQKNPAIWAHSELVKQCSAEVKHYRNDLLIHDKNAIDAHPGTPFIHIAYKSGTHLYFKPDHEPMIRNERQKYLFGFARPSEIAKGHIGVIEDQARTIGRTFRLYTNDAQRGPTLRTITPDRAVELFTTWTYDAIARADLAARGIKPFKRLPVSQLHVRAN